MEKLSKNVIWNIICRCFDTGILLDTEQSTQLPPNFKNRIKNKIS